MFTSQFLLLYAIAGLWAAARAGISDFHERANVSEFSRHRQRRGLIFEGGGTLKLIIGPAHPVQHEDPINWRAPLIYTYNIHGGHYAVPTTPLYPWDKWEDTFARSLQTVHKYLDNVQHSQRTDESRLFVYTALENYLNRQEQQKGHVCLLRAICENAQVDHHVGMLGEVFNVLLTPGKEDLDPAYKTAREAGAMGVDCLKLYGDCPAGVSLLDSYFNYV